MFMYIYFAYILPQQFWAHLCFSKFKNKLAILADFLRKEKF